MRIQSKPYKREAKLMPVTFQNELPLVQSKATMSYESASYFAYSQGFVTLKQYSDYIESRKVSGFHIDPRQYKQYTTAWDFLKMSKEQYYQERSKILIAQRDPEAIRQKTLATKARRKAEREKAFKDAVAEKVTVKPLPKTGKTFSTEQVIDILVQSNASVEYIARFISTNKVNDAYAVTVLLNLLKSKTMTPATL